jgi:hypothetical protein
MEREKDRDEGARSPHEDETSAEKPMPIVTPEGPPPEDQRDDD